MKNASTLSRLKKTAGDFTLRSLSLAVCVSILTLCGAILTNAAQDASQSPSTTAKSSPSLGTIKSITGNSLVLASDVGAELHVDVRDSTKIVRIAPGQKDLKDAQPIVLTDLQVGDRILVRGQTDADGKTVAAASIIAMKKADIADKQTREREEWQKSGIGGLVSSLDPTASLITVTVPSLREKKDVAVHITSQTILRRYAPGSVKFDDAKPAPLAEIRPGDQLRARGTKNADGSELTASEVVSGSFRNISGEISSMDSGQGAITVHDLATKKSVTVKITPESQLRKLPAPMAQRIAQRLNGGGASQSGDQAAARSSSASSNTQGAPSAKDPGAPATGQDPNASGAARASDLNGRGRGMGAGAGGAGGGMDFQQMISRMPASSISDLQKGDAVMLVGTESGNNSITAITLLAGVEPILQGSPNGGASSILSPWTMSGAPSGGESGTP